LNEEFKKTQNIVTNRTKLVEEDRLKDPQSINTIVEIENLKETEQIQKGMVNVDQDKLGVETKITSKQDIKTEMKEVMKETENLEKEVKEVNDNFLNLYREVPQKFRFCEEEDLLMLRKLQELEFMKEIRQECSIGCGLKMICSKSLKVMKRESMKKIF
jgi:hypothetical protein